MMQIDRSSNDLQLCQFTFKKPQINPNTMSQDEYNELIKQLNFYNPKPISKVK